MDPVGSAHVVPDTSLTEQILERDQLMFVAYLVPVGLSRCHVLLPTTAYDPWNANANAIFAKSCRQHQSASVGCSVAFVARPTSGVGHGEIGAY